MTENLPANPMAKFAAKAEQHRRPKTNLQGGYLNFDGKSGRWTMGQSGEACDGALALVLSDSIQHGYIRWGTKPPDKVFTSVAVSLPTAPEPYEGVDDKGQPRTYNAQDARLFMGKFTGEDDDLGQFIFNSSSMGGVERTDELYDAIIAKSQESEYCYPLIELKCDYYTRSTGKVYKPIFKIVQWCNVEGVAETLDKVEKQPEPEPEPEVEEAPPARRRRRKVA